MRPTIPQSVQADLTCYSFLDLCFQVEPSKRATAEQLRKDPFADINVNLYLCFHFNIVVLKFSKKKRKKKQQD